MKALALGLLLVSCAGARAEERPAGPDSSLEGTRWRVRRSGLLQTVLFFWSSDTFEFSGGRFLSATALKKGFGAARYVGDASWSAVQINEHGEKLEWQGSTREGRMNGTVTWTRDTGRKSFYRWKARLKDGASAEPEPREPGDEAGDEPDSEAEASRPAASNSGG